MQKLNQPMLVEHKLTIEAPVQGAATPKDILTWLQRKEIERESVYHRLCNSFFLSHPHATIH